MKKLFGMLLFGLSVLAVTGKDIDLEKHVKQHWLLFQNKKIEVAPLVRWKASDEVKAQRLEYFKNCIRKFGRICWTNMRGSTICWDCRPALIWASCVSARN